MHFAHMQVHIHTRIYGDKCSSMRACAKARQRLHGNAPMNAKQCIALAQRQAAGSNFSRHFILLTTNKANTSQLTLLSVCLSVATNSASKEDK